MEKTDKTYIGNFDGQDLWYITGEYMNGRKYIEVLDENDEYYAEVTINLQNEFCPDHFGHINADLTQELVKFLRKKHIIGLPVETVQYNYGRYELCPLFV